MNNCWGTFKKCDENIESVHDFSLIDPFIIRREQARKASGEPNLKHKIKEVFKDSLINSTVGNLYTSIVTILRQTTHFALDRCSSQGNKFVYMMCNFLLPNSYNNIRELRKAFVGSLSKGVFERCTSAGSEATALLYALPCYQICIAKCLHSYRRFAQ